MNLKLLDNVIVNGCYVILDEFDFHLRYATKSDSQFFNLS